MKELPVINPGAPDTWTLPITDRSGPGMSLWLWQQQEYVTCVQCGFSFAAHRDGDVGVIWHYKLPVPAGFVYPSVSMGFNGATATVYDHRGNPFLRKPR